MKTILLSVLGWFWLVDFSHQWWSYFPASLEMPDNLWLGARHRGGFEILFCCFFLFSLENFWRFSPEMQLNYLELSWPIWGLVLGFVEWNCRCHYGLSFSTSAARPLWILHLGIRRFSKSGWWEQTPLLALCKLQAWFPLMLSDDSFLSLWWFFPIRRLMCVQWNTGEKLPEDLQHFVPCAISCPVNSSCFGLPGLSALSFPLTLSLGLCLGSPSLNHTLEMLSRQWFGVK